MGTIFDGLPYVRGRGAPAWEGGMESCRRVLCALLAVVIEPCFSSEANYVVGTEMVSPEVFV